MKCPYKKTEQGFTLTEILIVIGIFGLISTFSLLATMDTWRSYSFRSERNMIVSILQKARMQSLSNINQSIHGVYIDSNTYIIFEGNSFATRIPSRDEIYQSSATVSHSGTTEVIFGQLRGNATVIGGALTVQQGPNQSIISINNEGQISWTN